MVVGIYPVWQYGGRDITAAVIAGTGIATINIGFGYFAIEYAARRGMTTFLKVVLGGMGIRLILLLALLAVCIRVLHFHVTALVVSLFYFYAVFLTLEVIHIQRNVYQRTSDDSGTHS